MNTPSNAPAPGPGAPALPARAPSPDPRIPVVPKNSLLPLSHEQQGLWLASRLSGAGAGAAYNNVLVLRMLGDLDVPELERSLSVIVARHEILRTTYVEVAGAPRQQVGPPAPVRLERLTPPAEVCAAGWDSASFEAFVRAQAARPFDLEREWPWRGQLIALADRDHVLLLVQHHICTDAHAAALLFGELAYLYRATETQAPLPAPTIQYGDYAVWQRSRPAATDAQLAYWRERLAHRPEELGLPRQAEAAGGGHRREQRRFVLEPGATQPLEAFARGEGATLFTAILAGLAVVLGRIGGDRDILIGVSTSLRRAADLQPLLGVLVNDLVVRADLEAAATFRDLLAQARTSLRDGFAHAVPFDELVRALNPDRTAAHGRLCQVSINYHKTPPPPPPQRGQKNPVPPQAARAARDDHVLEVDPAEGALHCLIDFDAAALDRQVIDQVAEGLAVFLREAPARADAPLDTIPTIAPATLEARRRELPRGLVTPAPDTTVTALFAERVRATPARLAVRDDTDSCTAAELDERSNRLAHLLIAHGAGPGARIGLCLPRSVGFVTAALAVLKAGAAYVPLDPEHPPERLARLSGQARLSCLVTTRRLAGRVTASGPPLLLVDEQEGALARQAATAPDVRIAPDSPAYVLFTSGSTGHPRGVVGLHRGIANRIAWMQRAYPFGAGEVCAQKTAMGFVDAVWETFGPLVCGVPLVVLPDPVVRDARALVERLAAERVTRVVLVPSLLDAILDLPVDLATPLAALRLAVSSGEPLRPALARRCLDRLPGLTLLNIYGTSEVSADATCAEVHAGLIDDVVPAGTPIDNVAVYVLDRGRQPVARGQVGEVWVGGAAVAAGYLADPEATAERFVTDPFTGTPGARMFRTGDRGRLRLDGSLEIAGRVDHQIKLLGRRIDPGEVEGALEAHPSIRQAAVVCRDADTGRPRLVGFVVPREGAPPPAPGELAAFLRRALPAYMVPATFVTLAALPLTPHGKVDRRGLASLEVAPADDAGPPPDPPSTPVEIALGGMWQDVLGTAARSVDDDFFAAGGHSLLATALLWRIRERWGLDIAPAALFEHPTIRSLAEHIDRSGAGARTALPPIPEVPRDEPILASPAQRRFWLDERLHPSRGAQHLSGAYLLAGPLDAAALDRSLTEIVARHEGLRTGWEDVDGELRLTIHPARAHETPVEDLTAVPADEQLDAVGDRLRAEHVRAFDPRTEPPFRTRLYRLAPDRHVLGIVVHHGAIDGWSTGLLLTELGARYRGLRHGRPLALPPVLQYADFSAWQHARLAAGDFDAQRDYWRRQLAGAPTGLDLPVDRPGDERTAHAVARHAVAIDDTLTNRLRSLGRAEGATLFMTLAAAYAVLLARYTGQWELVVGTVSANRRLPATESTIGAVVNTLALRVGLDAEAGFARALRHARAVVTGALDNQDVPFDVVVADVTPERHGGRGPLFQTFFVLQDRGSWQLDLDGLDATELDVVAGTTPLPLSLVLYEAQGGVRGYFEYSRDLFDAATVERLGANLVTLLGAAAAAPETPVADLAVVSEAELAEVRAFERRPSRDPEAPGPATARLDERFAHHVSRTPDA
ncbi:MAG: amino acid adenylation domain-containing protein, partial [Vicinamibacterales bacterium]